MPAAASPDAWSAYLATSKDLPIYKGHVKAIDDEEVRALRTPVMEMLTEPKYVRMAAFAEL